LKNIHLALIAFYLTFLGGVFLVTTFLALEVAPFGFAPTFLGAPVFFGATGDLALTTTTLTEGVAAASA